MSYIASRAKRNYCTIGVNVLDALPLSVLNGGWCDLLLVLVLDYLDDLQTKTGKTQKNIWVVHWFSQVGEGYYPECTNGSVVGTYLTRASAVHSALSEMVLDDDLIDVLRDNIHKDDWLRTVALDIVDSRGDQRGLQQLLHGLTLEDAEDLFEYWSVKHGQSNANDYKYQTSFLHGKHLRIQHLALVC